jgi:FkbM family methyltransferase
MKYYSQYGEDKLISQYIKESFTGNILDIGANDGYILSNSLHFIEKGWGATLIEAAPIPYNKARILHENNHKVQCLNVCLSDVNEKFTFYHNINHLNKNDTDLLSTISKDSFINSSKSGDQFESFEIDCCRFENIKKELLYRTYQIISIDIEGYDYQILSQINLTEIGCEILIIEYNNDMNVRNQILTFCKQFNIFDIIHDNTTNIIIAKK